MISSTTNMDRITKAPGLIHIAEQIFSYLDRNDLMQCQEVNEYWASILRNPWFWYRRMTQKTILSQEHQKEWMDFCEKLSKSNLTNDMTPGLNFIYQQLEESVRLNTAYKAALSVTSADTIEIMAPLIKCPNAPGENGRTPIHEAARYGHTEIVKILASLTDNPNAPDKGGETPIYIAARYGHTEIVKILVPLTDNPNAPERYHYGQKMFADVTCKRPKQLTQINIRIICKGCEKAILKADQLNHLSKFKTCFTAYSESELQLRNKWFKWLTDKHLYNQGPLVSKEDIENFSNKKDSGSEQSQE